MSNKIPHVLVADIGGTHARLALFSTKGEPVFQNTYASRAYDELEDIFRDFLGQTSVQISNAAVGIAGPIIDQKCKVTNRPWMIEASKLASIVGTPKLTLYNDVMLAAAGLEHLTADQMLSLQPGKPQSLGPRCLVMLGSGFGMARAFHDQGKWVVSPSEAGHARFSCTDPRFAKVHEFLSREHNPVEVEHVISGLGLEQLFLFQAAQNPDGLDVDLSSILSSQDINLFLVDLALNKKSQICETAVDMLVEAFAHELQNIALREVATGGIFIGGGLALAIQTKLFEKEFLEKFVSHGRFGDFLNAIPIHLVHRTELALLGGFHVATLK